MGKRELVALLRLSSWCLVIVVWLFLAVSCVCLSFVVVVLHDHNHYFYCFRRFFSFHLQSLKDAYKISFSEPQLFMKFPNSVEGHSDEA